MDPRNGNGSSNGRLSVTRPSDTSKGVTFIYRPEQIIAELVYSHEKGFQFAVKTADRNDITYEPTVEGKEAPQWLGKVINVGSLWLPSEAHPHGNTSRLLNDVCGCIRKYFDCSNEFLFVAGVYTLTTWLYDRFSAFPYLRFLGPRGTGKTRGTEVIAPLCYRAAKLGGGSSPAMYYRLIEFTGGTLAIDEADWGKSSIGADISKILNTGYSANNPVWKSGGDDFAPQPFNSYGPKIINGRKRFDDDATESRCLTYQPTETTRKDIPRQLPEAFYTEAQELRNRCLSWRLEWYEKLVPRDAAIDGLVNRTNQILLPLLNAVSLLDDAEMRSTFYGALVSFGKTLDEKARETDKDRPETKMLEIVVSLIKSGTLSPALKTIVAEAVSRYGGDDPTMLMMTPKKVGQILREELGFETFREGSGYVVLPMAPARLAALCQRSGVTPPEP